MSWRSASGLRSWFLQRISAVYMAVFIVVWAIAMASGVSESYPEWRAWVAHPVVNIAMALFFMALISHTWVGMRDVIVDYVHPLYLRLTLLVLIALWLLAMLVGGLKTLFMLAA